MGGETFSTSVTPQDARCDGLRNNIASELLVLAERERGLHLGEISLNYINTALIVVDRQSKEITRGRESVPFYVYQNFVQKHWLSLFVDYVSINNFVKQKKGKQK